MFLAKPRHTPRVTAYARPSAGSGRGNNLASHGYKKFKIGNSYLAVNAGPPAVLAVNGNGSDFEITPGHPLLQVELGQRYNFQWDGANAVNRVAAGAVTENTIWAYLLPNEAGTQHLIFLSVGKLGSGVGTTGNNTHHFVKADTANNTIIFQEDTGTKDHGWTAEGVNAADILNTTL